MEAFLARQPILDRELKVFGYELLFRSGSENFFRSTDGDLATNSVVSDAVHLHSIEKVTDGRHCFINFTRNAIISELYALLPPATTVVEVLETVELDDELLAACQRIRSQGYTLALDDYILEPRFGPLLSLIDLLKVEFPALSDEQHQRVVALAVEHGFKLLAEKVETPEQYELALSHGYDYFQGYFFCRPQLLRARRIPASRAHFLRLLQLVNAAEFDIDRIDELIRGDVALSYKLLRYLNSPLFGLQNAVKSVRHAITALGQRSLRKWVSLISVNELSEDKPAELITTCLVRGRFCELAGELVLDRSLASDCFMAGMFSLLDAILDQPMGDLIEELHLAPATQSALMKQESPLLPILDLAVALESGDWPTISRLATQLALPEEAMHKRYLQSIEWVSEIRAVSDTAT